MATRNITTRSTSLSSLGDSATEGTLAAYCERMTELLAADTRIESFEVYVAGDFASVRERIEWDYTGSDETGWECPPEQSMEEWHNANSDLACETMGPDKY